MINIQTLNSDNDCRGLAGFAYGNYDQRTADFSLSGPLVQDRLFAGFTGRYDLRDGFVHNLTPDSHPDTKDTLGGRIHLRWTPTDRLEFAVIATADRYNDGMVPTYYPTVDDGPFEVRRDYEGYVDTERWSAALKAAWTGDTMKVMSTTAWRQWEQDLLFIMTSEL